MIQLKVALNTKKQPTNPSFLDYDITGFFKMSSGMGATSVKLHVPYDHNVPK
jgi:hypothetical protein